MKILYFIYILYYIIYLMKYFFMIGFYITFKPFKYHYTWRDYI